MRLMPMALYRLVNFLLGKKEAGGVRAIAPRSFSANSNRLRFNRNSNSHNKDGWLKRTNGTKSWSARNDASALCHIQPLRSYCSSQSSCSPSYGSQTRKLHTLGWMACHLGVLYVVQPFPSLFHWVFLIFFSLQEIQYVEGYVYYVNGTDDYVCVCLCGCSRLIPTIPIIQHQASRKLRCGMKRSYSITGNWVCVFVCLCVLHTWKINRCDRFWGFFFGLVTMHLTPECLSAIPADDGNGAQLDDWRHSYGILSKRFNQSNQITFRQFYTTHSHTHTHGHVHWPHSAWSTNRYTAELLLSLITGTIDWLWEAFNRTPTEIIRLAECGVHDFVFDYTFMPCHSLSVTHSNSFNTHTRFTIRFR